MVTFFVVDIFRYSYFFLELAAAMFSRRGILKIMLLSRKCPLKNKTKMWESQWSRPQQIGIQNSHN